MANLFDEVESEFSKLLPKTTIEMESGFENIPSGSRVRTQLTESGEPVEGYAYPEFGQVTLGHTPLTAAPRKPPVKRSIGSEILGSFGKGTQSGMAGLAGLPVDAATMGLNLIPGVNIQNPVGGSQSLRQLQEKAVGPWTPQGAMGKTAAAIGEQAPGIAAAPFMPGGAGATNYFSQVARMAPSGIGAGLGTVLARTAFPGSPGAEIAGNILGAVAGSPRSITGGVLGTAAEALEGKAPGVSSKLGRAAQAITPAIDDIDSAIKRDYTKAVRPSVSGKQSFTDWKQAQDKAVGAVKQIVNTARANNQPIPKTMEEFSQSIENTRQNVFKQYNEFTKQTGSKGAMIDMQPLANDLRAMAKDKLTKYGKGAVEHAEELANQLSTDRYFTPEEAERVIAIWNNQLSSFYKNRMGSLTETTAGITDSAARYLRAALDDTVEKFTGPGYQQLKNKYGELRSIEKDVINRTIVNERKAPAGLIDFTDMFSISKGLYSAAKLDPAGAAAAGALYATKRWMKGLNDPDRIVKRMFSNADKYVPQPQKFYGPAERELGFTMSGPLKNQPMPTPSSRRYENAPLSQPPTIEGELLPPLPGQGQLPAPPPGPRQIPAQSSAQPETGFIMRNRNPATTPTPPTAANARQDLRTNRMLPSQADTRAPQDFAAMSVKLGELGFSKQQIQEMFRKALEAEMIRRGMR